METRVEVRAAFGNSSGTALVRHITTWGSGDGVDAGGGSLGGNALCAETAPRVDHDGSRSSDRAGDRVVGGRISLRCQRQCIVRGTLCFSSGKHNGDRM